MTVVRDTTADVDAVWSVLTDGWSYGMWVVGASRIRAVDPRWPHIGSRIHHSFGLWPFVVDDVTVVRRMIERRELVLEARALPAGRAEIILRLHPTPTGCRIEMIEHAASAPFEWVPDTVQHLAVHPRNTEALRRLAFLAERATR